MFKVLSFLTKTEGIEMQAFIDYYENKHVPLILRLALNPIVINADTLYGASN
jgi:hypothetical protein